MPAPEDMQLVRDARVSDLDALLTLEQASFDRDRLSRRQYRHHLQSASARLLAVVDGAQLVGSAVLLFRRGTRVARLYSLAVDPVMRGRGVGRRLLAAAEHAARARDCTRIRLEVRVDNRAAQSLYESAGFRRCKQRTGYYADGADAWLYQKTLPAAPD
jgi:[ribosomal protein S18]-alanine N-acetyltransferase